MNDDYGPIWWRAKDPDERARRLIATTDNLESRLRGRVNNALTNIELYEGRALGNLSASAYAAESVLLSLGPTSEPSDVKVNLARALVNTAVSQVAGKQRPISQFVTSGADWDTKRKAKRLERFCQAVKLQRQGPFLSDFWAVGVAAFRHQCVGDSLWIKFWIDWANRQWRAAPVPWWQILVDPTEAASGEPQSLFHVYPYSKDKLAAEYPEHEATIMSAPTISTADNSRGVYGSDLEASRMIKVREGWRLALSKKEPGAWSLVVGGGRSGAVDLLAEKDGTASPWTRTFFPFETSSWEPHLQGIFGSSVIDTVRGICIQLNSSVQRRAEAERVCSNLHIAYEEESLNAEDLEDNRIGVRIPYKKGFAPPKFEVPESTAQGSIQWASQLVAWAHDITGISEQSATATKQPGIESKVAIVEVENIQSDRLGIQIQNYERIMSVGADRQIIAAFRELAEEVGDDKLVVQWPGGASFKELQWSKCSLEDEQFVAQPMGVSGLSITPAARKEVALDLLDRQLIDGDTYKSIIQFNDLDGELEKGNAIQFWCDDCIETWLDVEEDDVDDPKKFRFKGPLPLMYGLQAQISALVRVGNAYLLQDADGCPQWRLEFFLRFIDQTSVQINKLQARQAELQGAAKGNTVATQQIQQPQQ